ncbi:DHA2 family efflux MFS transporter permease subunit [Granulicoccus phenolivorans]|uniref:DHA2 family efflux MFS transporter permease subunit n=1 Tax=Granulicoccus phenolivorans TaxID=266854 RepID=UPI0009DB90DA|nr:DHA2 family efflux MFS transporter permease subunit [Granulicoccus phenolivorans]
MVDATGPGPVLPSGETDPRAGHPWRALWAMILGFFMILLDSTIVSVATPHIMRDLQADISQVIWVTSAYLLAFAVPLLLTGRLGDRFGPRRVFLVGLVVFIGSSLWCGLAGNIEGLIIARIAQGLGASAMSPQPMTLITRLFPPERRGAAMGVWGSVAGVAVLVGPLLGGVLTDIAGWSWIFFINVPVGVVAFVLTVRLAPRLTTHAHSFDWLGIALSGIGLFLIVYGLQEGQSHQWGALWGPIQVWQVIAAGVVVMAAFVFWQSRNTGEPLLPLNLFRDRNFTLANVNIALTGAAITAQTFPIMLFTQSVLGYSPTVAALTMAPMAVVQIILAPQVGRMLNRISPGWFVLVGAALQAVAVFGYAALSHADTRFWQLLIPSAIQGVGGACFWGPNSVTTTRNLPREMAGAGSGVYNATRQLGAVIGSAAIAAMMEARLAVHLPGVPAQVGEGGGRIPPALAEPFSRGMGESLLLPGVLLTLVAVIALFYARPGALRTPAPAAGPPVSA